MPVITFLSLREEVESSLKSLRDNKRIENKHEQNKNKIGNRFPEFRSSSAGQQEVAESFYHTMYYLK